MSTLPLGNRPLGAPLAVCDGGVLSLAGTKFVAGNENRLLAAVITQWCDAVGSSTPIASPAWNRMASPLVLVGATGCGKTHLAEGLAERAGSRGVYFTANDLRRDFAEAIQQEDARGWRSRLAATPLLVLDDIDHLPPHSRFQQELLHLIDELEHRGHKLVVTSAQMIPHLRGWLPSLSNRFAAGLTVEIAPLEATVRSGILQLLASRFSWQIAPEALEMLAEQAPGKPRELLTLLGEMQQRFAPGAELGTEQIETFLRRRKAARAPDLATIIRVVSRYYSIPLKVLTSSSRKTAVVAARGVVVYLARELTSISYEQIGRQLGGRDHTTILHSYDRVRERLTVDPPLRQSIDQLQILLRRPQ